VRERRERERGEVSCSLQISRWLKHITKGEGEEEEEEDLYYYYSLL
jgi:hypothetical protein